MKDLNWGRKILESINFDIGNGPKSKLDKFGFRKLSGVYSHYVWFHKKKNIIIKIGELSTNEPPINMIPSLVIPKYDRLYIVQYKADRRNKKKALAILEEKFNKIDTENRGLSNVWDIHEENVGWYNKQAIVFDW